MIKNLIFFMLSGLSWVGGKAMSAADKFGGPVEISEEEMNKAKQDILDSIELSKKRGQG